MGAYIRTPRLELRIDDYINAGCIGAVFRATETSLGRPFAVKIVSKTPRWALEGFFHGTVSAHPNIVTLHSISENKDFGFLVLDYCDGLDLHRSVYYSRAFAGDTNAIKHVFLQIIEAVQHCHQNTVYHRDLKLGNVLYDSRTGKAFLTDFGVSTNESRTTEYRAGTVRSMSPREFQIRLLLKSQPLTPEFTECYWKQTADTRDGGTGYSSEANDVWSLGVMLYNLITADNLWARPTVHDPVYSDFFYNPDFWRKRAPLSLETVALLDYIFYPPEKERISLYRLKQAVERIKTFYMSQRDLVSASRKVQESARRHGPWTRPSREVYATSVERREESCAVLWDARERRTSGRIAQPEHDRLYPSSAAHTPVNTPHAASYGKYIWTDYVR